LQNLDFFLKHEDRRGTIYEEKGNQWEGGEEIKEEKRGEYEQSTLYTCIKMSSQNPLFCTINKH
jgi:hypothetical protein